MENYVCASICIIILSVCGSLDGILERAGLKWTDAAFAALCVVSLSLFRFKPILEFDIDVASLALPVVFGLLAVNRDGQASKVLSQLTLVSTIPIAVRAAFMLYELYMTTYAFFSLRADSICLVQIALCGIDLAVISFRSVARKAV